MATILQQHLTHLPVDKMAATTQTLFPYACLWMERFLFRFQISLRFVLYGPINDNPALV